MKKQFVFMVIIISLFSTQKINAQSFSMRFYSDFNSGHMGWAAAEFVSPSQRSTIESNFWAMPRRTIERLSNSTSWLAWQALGEWELRNGDMFAIQISETGNFNTGVLLLVTIADGGRSFNWWGKAF